MAQKQIQFYNFEDPDVYALGDWKAIYDYIKVRLLPDRMNYIFLDEVQHVTTFQRLVDGLFIKDNCDVYITGSNAHLLSGELATLLTGRYIETSILPLQFEEACDLMVANSPNLSKTESLGKYIIEGGIPEYYRQQSASQAQADGFISGVLNTIIEKDSNPKYLLTMDMDLGPVYNGIRKLNVVDWLLDSSRSSKQ